MVEFDNCSPSLFTYFLATISILHLDTYFCSFGTHEHKMFINALFFVNQKLAWRPTYNLFCGKAREILVLKVCPIATAKYLSYMFFQKHKH